MKIIKILIAVALFNQLTYAQVPSYVSTNGLVGYWPFNGNANDASGNVNNGTVTGATLTTDRFGNSNSSYEFNGTSNKINFGSSQSLINLSNFTYSVWINRSPNCPNDAIVISNYGGNWAGNLLFGKLTGSGNAQIRLHKLNQTIGSETSITDSEWINLVAVKEMNSIKIYKNGVLIQTTDLTNFVSINNTSFPFVIGSSGWSNSNYFKGKIDDLGVWNRALTQAEITGLFTTLGTEQTPANNQISIYPNPAKEQITIDFGTNSIAIGWNYKIVNTLGQEVLNGVLSSQQNIIALNNIKGQGVYFVKVYDGFNALLDTKKIIIQQ